MKTVAKLELGAFHALDELTEQLIAKLKEDNMFTLDSKVKHNANEYGNIAIGAANVHSSYLNIRAIYRKRRNAPVLKKAQIVDFGSGIGNVINLLKKMILADTTMFKQGVIVSANGVEKIKKYIDASLSGEITELDLNNYVKRENYMIKKASFNADMRIWYCNRPFSREEDQRLLEIDLISIAPKGTFLVNPMGFTLNLNQFNVRVINKTLIVKK